MKRALEALGAAFAYFSILPAGRFARGPAPGSDVLLALPVVGLTLGALAGSAGYGAALLGAPAALRTALAFAVVVVGSGAIHVDGYLDSCDALFASVDLQRRHEILKDPRHGTFALAGMAVFTVVWCAAVAALPAASLPAALAIAGAGARLGAVGNAVIYPYGRAGAPSRALAERTSPVALGMIGLFVLACAFALAPAAALSVAIGLLVALGLGRWAAARLGGGLTGDAYGFIAVVLETALVSAFALCRIEAG